VPESQALPQPGTMIRGRRPLKPDRNDVPAFSRSGTRAGARSIGALKNERLWAMRTTKKTKKRMTKKRVTKERVTKKTTPKAFHWTDHEIVEHLVAFSPASAGPVRARAVLALQSARQTFPLICSLIETVSQPLLAPRRIETTFPVRDDAAQLEALLQRYGSDKSTLHNYHLLYAALLGPKRNDPLRLLEIGIGTNNPEIVSTMGPSGKPGASLRAFRDFCPNAQVFGADFDRRILFEEERIRTYFVDQTRYSSFDELSIQISERTFDLVIDDGLHSPNANIATMLFALRILRSDGYFIVEDIPESALPIWQVVGAVLPEGYRPLIVEAKYGWLFMIQKPRFPAARRNL
jgi:SAM-dependent methyltransferase